MRQDIRQDIRRNKSIVGNKHTKSVTSRRIAWLLRKDGYRIIKTIPNRYKPDFDVYIFDVVPGFEEALLKHVNNAKEYRMKRDGARK